MPTTAGTTSGGLPYPGDSTAPDVPAHFKALADAVEARFQAGVEVSTLQGSSGPQLNLYHTSASTDRKRVRLSTVSGVTKLAARNDADSADTHVGLSLDNATGVVDHPSGITGTGATFAGAFRHTGSTFAIFNATPTTKPGSTAELKAALASLGILTDGGASPLNLDGGTLTAGAVSVAGPIDGQALSGTTGYFSSGVTIDGGITVNAPAGFNSQLAVQSSLFVDATGVKVQGSGIGGGVGAYFGSSSIYDVSAVAAGQRQLLSGSSTARIEQVLASLIRDLYDVRIIRL